MQETKVKNLTWHTEKRKVKDLVPADYNPRTITEKEKADLMSSVVEFGKVVPIVVNTGMRKNNIIGGHQRVQIYADLGEGDQEIEVRVPSRELSDEEEMELNIRLNKNTGSWDFEKLAKGFDMEELTSWGFVEEDLKAWFGIAEASDIDIDEERMGILTVLPPEAPALREKVVVKFLSKADYDIVKQWILQRGGTAAAKILLDAATEKES